jgi:hypothetical protein
LGSASSWAISLKKTHLVTLISKMNTEDGDELCPENRAYSSNAAENRSSVHVAFSGK